ncbi:hypothetical protein DFO74_1651, partial [Chromohalobacter israelensis]
HHQSPIVVMKEWQAKRPELFTKRVVNHTGPDTYIISESDLVVTVTDKLAKATLYRFGLEMHEHPFSFPEIPINLFWHRRFHQDSGTRWLRNLIFEMFSE